MTAQHARPRLLVHTSIQPIRWGDMDSLGHVNNTVYFRHMEQARIEWLFAQAGVHDPYATSSGPVIVVVPPTETTMRRPVPPRNWETE